MDPLHQILVAGEHCPHCQFSQEDWAEERVGEVTFDDHIHTPITTRGVILQCTSCGMQSYPLETKKKLEEEIHLQWQTPSPERIKELRCKTQSTPEELGILMGLSPKHIPKWESGDWFPKPSETNFLRILAEKPEMIDWLKSQQN